MDVATMGAGTMGMGQQRRSQGGSEAQQHAEGPVARRIEEQTAKLPSDLFLWAAGASIIGSLSLMCTGNRHGALFVGQWAPTFLILGLYNKVVKVAGSDRTENSSSMGGRERGESSASRIITSPLQGGHIPRV